MKEVRISKTANGVVKASSVVSKITDVEQRYELSKNKVNNLLKNLNNNHTANLIKDTDTKWWKFGGYNTEELHQLISESHKSNSETNKNICDIITHNNENTRDLSEMIRALAILSGLSFEKIFETTAELDQITKQLESSSNNSGKNSSNIKRVVVSQINKVKEDKKRQENIDYNFGILNENLKELQNDYVELKKDYKKSQKEIKQLINSTSKEHFLKVLKRQKKFIYLLFIFLLLTIGFSAYIIFINNLL